MSRKAAQDDADPAAQALPSPAVVRKTAAMLGDWFAANQRVLPWRLAYAEPESGLMLRETAVDKKPRGNAKAKGTAYPEPPGAESAPRRDPYRTWISEIMLQQTQVATVVDYYNRWMLRFPDVAALAGAAEQDVLEAWAGLGYYSRARNVLATARKVVEDHGGRFPRTREDLLALKGVGEYTAGAIASLAFDRPEPILDGNLVRVFSRLYGLEFLPDTKDGKKAYWDLARAWAGTPEPGLVNEGLMELGALVCTPRNPDCDRCPLAGACAALRMDARDRFPPARSRKDAVDVSGYAVAAFRKRGGAEEVLLYTPRKSERLAGLLTFPIFAVAGLPALRTAWAAVPGLPKASLRPRAVTVTHSITHHRYRLRVVEAGLEAGSRDAALPEGYAWAPAGEMDRLLVSSLPRKIWQALR